MAKFHAGMETGLGSEETESANRFLGMEAKVEGLRDGKRGRRKR